MPVSAAQLRHAAPLNSPIIGSNSLDYHGDTFVGTAHLCTQLAVLCQQLVIMPGYSMAGIWMDEAATLWVYATCSAL